MSFVKRINVLEDEQPILDVIMLFLTLEGYQVSGSTKEGGFWSLDHPDLILLDYGLQGRNGCEICIDLKANNQFNHIPVILMSAGNYLAEKADNCRADDYLTKPFELQELAFKVQYLLGLVPL